MDQNNDGQPTLLVTNASSASSPRRALAVGLLLLGSGFAGLVYQIVWLREMRLVFGASTAAVAKVNSDNGNSATHNTLSKDA